MTVQASFRVTKNYPAAKKLAKFLGKEGEAKDALYGRSIHSRDFMRTNPITIRLPISKCGTNDRLSSPDHFPFTDMSAVKLRSALIFTKVIKMVLWHLSRHRSRNSCLTPISSYLPAPLVCRYRAQEITVDKI